jgi:uncharacterized protein
MTRMIFGGLGWCAVALAIAGIIVPGLPTTLFVIAASYCFSRSSPRFERCRHLDASAGTGIDSA